MRDATIDIAKGIGILTVVLCHNWILYENRGELSRIVFSFHMPLFFFISGLFFKPNQTFYQLLISKADALLKPFFIVLIGIFIFDYFFFQPIDVTKKIIELIYASGTTVSLIPLWFLSHLYFVFIFAWAINKWILSKINNTAGKSIFLLILLLIGAQTASLFWYKDWQVFGLTKLVFGEGAKFKGLPFNLDIILLTTTFFLSGYLFAKNFLDFKFKPIYASFALILFSALHYFYNETIELNSRQYGNFFICTLQIISGIYLVFSAASLIKNFKRFSDVFCYIGAASLMILIVHFQPQHKLTGIFHYHLPEYKFAAASLSLIASVVLSLIAWRITLNSTWLSQLILPLKNR